MKTPYGYWIVAVSLTALTQSTNEPLKLLPLLLLPLLHLMLPQDAEVSEMITLQRLLHGSRR
jgi:hypothetical protein